jgi:hypothetical protein
MIEQIVKTVAKKCGVKRAEVVEREVRGEALARDVALWTLACEPGLSSKTTGNTFGIGEDAVTKTAARTSARMSQDKKLRTAAETAVRAVFKVCPLPLVLHLED